MRGKCLGANFLKYVALQSRCSHAKSKLYTLVFDSTIARRLNRALIRFEFLWTLFERVMDKTLTPSPWLLPVLLINAWRKISEFFSLWYDSYQAKITQVKRSFLLCEYWIPFTLVFTCLFCWYLRSCDRKFVFRFWTPTRCRRSVATVVNIYHRSLYKGKAHCHKSLFFACKGLGNFPKQILGEKKRPDFFPQKFSGLRCR